MHRLFFEIIYRPFIIVKKEYYVLKKKKFYFLLLKNNCRANECIVIKQSSTYLKLANSFRIVEGRILSENVSNAKRTIWSIQ